MWAGLLGPHLTRRQYFGFSECAVKGPTAECLKGRAVIGLYFSANWCQACSEFMSVLERLYTVQKARGADQLEVVLVSWCREAKALKYYSLTMPWLSMWHNANNKVGMKARTMTLMGKFGISTIPALILLIEWGHVICLEARGWVNADPKGKAFPWRETAEAPMPGLAERAVVNFDLPPTEQPKLLVPPVQRQRANRSPSKFLRPKQDPVSTVHSAGGHGGGEERLANGPSPPARPMASLNFDLPPAKQPT